MTYYLCPTDGCSLKFTSNEILKIIDDATDKQTRRRSTKISGRLYCKLCEIPLSYKKEEEDKKVLKDHKKACDELYGALSYWRNKHLYK